MIIDTSELGAEQRAFEGVEPESIWAMDDEGVRPVSPLKYQVTARLVGERLVVRGRLDARVEFLCGRCGEGFGQDVADPRFCRDYELSEPGQSVDLTPDMREAIILSFPTYPLCDEGCRGVCPGCGANRNRGSCSCRDVGGPGWSMLDGLTLK